MTRSGACYASIRLETCDGVTYMLAAISDGDHRMSPRRGPRRHKPHRLFPGCHLDPPDNAVLPAAFSVFIHRG